MSFSGARGIVKSHIAKHGSDFESDDDTFKGFMLKANANADLPRSEFVLFTSYNATINDGFIVRNASNDNRYVPLKIDKQDLIGNDVYKKTYLRQVNASGSLQHYINPSNASKDIWDVPTGTEGTDWGWVTKKTSVYVNFEKIYLREQTDRTIGDIETPEFFIFMPYSVNASHTPIAGDRFATIGGSEWKLEGVDGYSYELQAYMARVIKDDR